MCAWTIGLSYRLALEGAVAGEAATFLSLYFHLNGNLRDVACECSCDPAVALPAMSEDIQPALQI